METYEANLDPLTESCIKIKLFRKVQNVPELRTKILDGELKCCVIKPTLIVDPLQVVVAANKALIARKQEKLVTRSIFSEILFNLSVSKNVSKSLPKFGIDDKYTDILVAIICEKGTNSYEIFKQIHGEERRIAELKDITDLNAVRKVYSINSEEEKYSSILDSIVNRIVIKDFN